MTGPGTVDPHTSRGYIGPKLQVVAPKVMTTGHIGARESSRGRQCPQWTSIDTEHPSGRATREEVVRTQNHIAPRHGDHDLTPSSSAAHHVVVGPLGPRRHGSRIDRGVRTGFGGRLQRWRSGSIIDRRAPDRETLVIRQRACWNHPAPRTAGRRRRVTTSNADVPPSTTCC